MRIRFAEQTSRSGIFNGNEDSNLRIADLMSDPTRFRPARTKLLCTWKENSKDTTNRIYQKTRQTNNGLRVSGSETAERTTGTWNMIAFVFGSSFHCTLSLFIVGHKIRCTWELNWNSGLLDCPPATDLNRDARAVRKRTSKYRQVSICNHLSRVETRVGENVKKVIEFLYKKAILIKIWRKKKSFFNEKPKVTTMWCFQSRQWLLRNISKMVQMLSWLKGKIWQLIWKSLEDIFFRE